MTEVAENDGEIARLRQELDKACHERVQAAEYGLEVLNQKDLLQQQYTDLESQFEVVKHELECVKQVRFLIFLQRMGIINLRMYFEHN